MNTDITIVSTCKNCNNQLRIDQPFCANCGAKIVTNRLTVKSIFSDFASHVIGWDNKFFRTVRILLTKPQLVLKEYIGGTRKKYMNPFTFLAIGSAVALFVFNFFSEDYLALNVESNKQITEILANSFGKQMGEGFDVEAYKTEQLANITKTSTFFLKYFNLLVLVFMPFYTLLAKIVYGKPYNYAEHLVINSFIQGITFWVTALFFVITIYTDPSEYFFAMSFTVLYYLYAYGKLYELPIAESILKFFKFCAFLVLFVIVIMIIGIVLGIIFAMINH